MVAEKPPSRGRPASAGLSKSGRVGVQAMEVVQDTPDPDDMIYSPHFADGA